MQWSCALPPKADIRQSLDDLVGAGEQRRRHGEAERLGRLEVDHKLVGRRRLDRHIGWLLTLEDAIDVSRGVPDQIRGSGP